VVNFIKVGAREDASAILEEICSWWPGNRHDFGWETSRLPYKGGEEGDTSVEGDEEEDLLAQKRAE
jgi:hypothetical protein